MADSILDRLPMTGMKCLLRGPDGQRCRFETDFEHEMDRHMGDHTRPETYGHWWDNCQVCGKAINLTAAMVLRSHGTRARGRCAGSGNVGTFQLRCRGERRRIGG
jgi:hypothetical protein